MAYTHLTKEERDKLAVLRSRGWKLREIAEKLGRNVGTLSRELKRNKSPGAYLPHKAQERAERREIEEHKCKRLKTYALQYDIERLVMKNWSPEIIAGRLKEENGNKAVISHEAIYQWVYASAPHLIGYLPRAHKERYPKHYSRSKGLKIPDRVSIKDRPKSVDTREEPGNWEADLMVSNASKKALQVCAERTSRLTRIKKLENKTAGQSREALENILKVYPKRLRQTITYDNGSENIEHGKLNKAIGTRSYFCEPYHSWEKGTVENTNGLIRRFLPKKTDFAKISEEKIAEIELWLNNRPRKCLGFRTPAEVFNGFVALAP
jgi:IS30 family transposase